MRPGMRSENPINAPDGIRWSVLKQTPLAETLMVRAAHWIESVDTTTGKANGKRTAQRTSD